MSLLEFLSQPSEQYSELDVGEIAPSPIQTRLKRTKAGEEGIYAEPEYVQVSRILSSLIPFGRQIMGEVPWRDPSTLMEAVGLFAVPVGVSRAAKLASELPRRGPLTVFHGTKSPTKFEIHDWLRGRDTQDAMSHVLDVMLGPHVARDPNVANVFTGITPDLTPKLARQSFEHLLYTSPKAAPRVIPLTLEGNIYKLPQNFPANVSDTFAFKIDAARKIFPKRKDLFVKWLTNTRGISKEEAERVWSALASGKPIKSGLKDSRVLSKRSVEFMKDTIGNVDFGSVAYNEGGLYDIMPELAKEYHKYLTRRGYSAIQYRNTAPSEIEFASDPTSYVVLQPEKLKSWFAREGKLSQFLKEHPIK